MIKCFNPIIGKQPKILILGSIPSVTSLEKQEYYGFKHNRFWKIMAYYFNCEFHSYEEKKQCILNHHIVLWDVIAYCNREGSLDTSIKNEECNDLVSLLKEYPSIQYVFCNGKKSYTLFQKHFSSLHQNCICLPSTSNANRSIKEEELFKIWYDNLQNCLKK